MGSPLPWFSTKGQIGQLVVAVLALIIGGIKFWPEMMQSGLLSTNSLLLYALVVFVVISIGGVIRAVQEGRHRPAHLPPADQPSPIGEDNQRLFALREQVVQAKNEILRRDEMIGDLRREILHARAELADTRDVLMGRDALNTQAAKQISKLEQDLFQVRADLADARNESSRREAAQTQDSLFSNHQTLRDYRRVRVRVLLKQIGDGGLEWIELAGAIAVSWFGSRRIEILGDGAAADPHMPRDFA